MTTDQRDRINTGKYLHVFMVMVNLKLKIIRKHQVFNLGLENNFSCD